MEKLQETQAWKRGMETSLPKSSIYIVIDDLLRMDVRPPTLKAF